MDPPPTHLAPTEKQPTPLKIQDRGLKERGLCLKLLTRSCSRSLSDLAPSSSSEVKVGVARDLTAVAALMKASLMESSERAQSGGREEGHSLTDR
ncbi:hypothetical protein ACFX12_022127 [Malus domestica]